MKSYKYENLSASQLAQALQEQSLVYVPIGTLEFHGRHLPLGMDTLHAYAFCLRVAEKTGGIVLPPTYWGTAGREGWTGSLLISEAAFRALVRDILRLLAEQKVKFVVTVTGHYPEVQGRILREEGEAFMERNPAMHVLHLDPFGTNPNDPKPDHGGHKETSLMLALNPDLVHMEELSHPEAMTGVTKNCVEGTAEYGRQYFEASVDNCARIVRDTYDQQQAKAGAAVSEAALPAAVGLAPAASPAEAHAMVDTPAKRKAYFEKMVRALVTDLGPHPTGSMEIEIAQKLYLAEIQRAIPNAHFERHWTEWQEIYPGAELVLDGINYVEVKACVGCAPTPVKGCWGVLRKVDIPGVPYALVDEKSGKVLVQIELSPYAGPVAGYMTDEYTMIVPRFSLGREDVPRIEEAIRNRTRTWARLHAMYFPANESNNIVATIPGESKEEILFVPHLDVFPICAGAIDNTGSVIVQLMLAHAVAGAKFKRTVTFLAPGSHELNSGGVQHYIKKRQMDGTIDDIKFLFIVDAVACGPGLTMTSRDKGLRDLYARIHEDLKIRLAPRLSDLHAHRNDGWFFRETSQARSAYLACYDDQPTHVGQIHHTVRDTADKLSLEGAETAFLVMKELIHRLQDFRG